VRDLAECVNVVVNALTGRTVTPITIAGLLKYTNGTPATTKFLKSNATGEAAWTVPAVADVTGAAPLASPTFTGTVTLPQQTVFQGAGNTISKESNTRAINVAAAPAVIATPVYGYGQLAFIVGVSTVSDRRFSDIVLFGGSVFNVISSLDIVNSPAARTYSSSGTLSLSMASGTYSINVKMFELQDPT